MKKTLSTALNQQINTELSAEYAYLMVYSFLEAKGLHGFAKWFLHQSQEEREHAMKFHQYMLDRGETPTFSLIPSSSKQLQTVRQAVEFGLESEENNTKKINALMKLAKEEQDYATEQFLMWFVEEQVEEEASMHGLLDALDIVQDDPSALMMLDKKLGKRAE